MPAVLLDQEVYRFLWDGDPADRGLGLGAGEGQFAIWIADVLLADEDRAVLYIQVIPEESDQLAFAETADQCQIEHGEEASGVGGVEVGFHVLGAESFSFSRQMFHGVAAPCLLRRNTSCLFRVRCRFRRPAGNRQ